MARIMMPILIGKTQVKKIIHLKNLIRALACKGDVVNDSTKLSSIACSFCKNIKSSFNPVSILIARPSLCLTEFKCEFSLTARLQRISFYTTIYRVICPLSITSFTDIQLFKFMRWPFFNKTHNTDSVPWL